MASRGKERSVPKVKRPRPKPVLVNSDNRRVQTPSPLPPRRFVNVHGVWATWSDAPQSRGMSKDEWDKSLRLGMEVCRDAEFWKFWDTCVSPLDLDVQCNVRLFRDGVKPTWEDSGAHGKFVVSAPRRCTHARYLTLLFHLVESSFKWGDPAQLCGIVLSIRPKGKNFISLWNMREESAESIEEMKSELAQIINQGENERIDYLTLAGRMELHTVDRSLLEAGVKPEDVPVLQQAVASSTDAEDAARSGTPLCYATTMSPFPTPSPPRTSTPLFRRCFQSSPHSSVQSSPMKSAKPPLPRSSPGPLNTATIAASTPVAVRRKILGLFPEEFKESAPDGASPSPTPPVARPAPPARPKPLPGRARPVMTGGLAPPDAVAVAVHQLASQQVGTGAYCLSGAIGSVGSAQPKAAQPKAEPKAEQPKVEPPKTDDVERAKARPPKAERPKVERPKVEPRDEVKSTVDEVDESRTAETTTESSSQGEEARSESPVSDSGSDSEKMEREIVSQLLLSEGKEVSSRVTRAARSALARALVKEQRRKTDRAVKRAERALEDKSQSDGGKTTKAATTTPDTTPTNTATTNKQATTTQEDTTVSSKTQFLRGFGSKCLAVTATVASTAVSIAACYWLQQTLTADSELVL